MNERTEGWPVAELDPVRQLRVLAAALPEGFYLREIHLDQPAEHVWARATDLEEMLPRCLATVRSVKILTPTQLYATSNLGPRAHFDVLMRPGLCVMRSRFVLGAMAAVPEDNGTRFAALGGLRLPGPQLAGGLLSPLTRPLLGMLGDRGIRRFTEYLTV